MTHEAAPSDLSRLTDSQLRRLVYSNWDFQQALSALTFFMEECDFDKEYDRIQLRRFRCYETTVVVSFARPFEDGRGVTTLGLRGIGVRLDVDEMALKARILTLRRKVIAHSDEEHMHFRGSTFSPMDDHPMVVPFFQFDESLHLERADLRPLETLLRKLTSDIYKSLWEIAQETPERLNVYRAPN